MRIRFSGRMRFKDDPGDCTILPKEIVVYSKMPLRYQLFVLIHEFVELHLCILFGLDNDTMNAIDMGKRSGANNYDRFRYDFAHDLAQGIECMFVKLVGASWMRYNDYIEKLKIR